MNKKLIVYRGETADVSWDGRLCIHIGECGRAEGNLFERGRKPWCDPDLASNEDVLNVVKRCPTGALSFESKDASEVEKVAPENVVVVSNHGPLYVTGALRIDGAGDDQPGLEHRAALCRCGQSNNKPFCDNSHETSGFADHGAVGQAGDGTMSPGETLTVKRAKGGPLLFDGSFSIVASSGRTAWRGKKGALCRCGASKNKPFCDGSHKAAGFDAD